MGDMAEQARVAFNDTLDAAKITIVNQEAELIEKKQHEVELRSEIKFLKRVIEKLIEY